MIRNQNKKDLKMGKLGELDSLPIINKYLNTEMKENSFWSLIDFEDDNTCCELKTRRVRHNQYRTLFMPEYKLKHKTIKDKKIYFAYNCIDGLFLFDYTENKDKCFTSYGGRKDRGKKEYSKMINIPTNLLIKINQIEQ